jgi:hypothetical protein
MKPPLVRLPLECADGEILAFARQWTERLAAEDYAGALAMLLPVLSHPGRSWVDTPEALRAWVVNYGSDEPIPDEDECRVTAPAETGEMPTEFLSLTREDLGQRYPGCCGRLDWPLPLDGEWSDLVASFDLAEVGGGLAFVLVALRVP